MAERHPSVYLFIFSDEPEWAIENFDTQTFPATVVDLRGCSDWCDMQLMSLCAHAVIANSSFSWWGAWLNASPEKTVIAPKQWFIDEKTNAETGDFVPEDWVRL